ncbi:MAG: phosphoribosyl-AMP cyclohydrolase [Gammaproteobacteria bacterium]|jgi:phosphoribosyl-AMP cyclohydrolase|nr:phosphoribosyl-AMP cyclohydrolase [Gammaproteobacteria bacterium]MAV66958.1 phosphoribosyl-AMP cyclohydrolase [Gammaproteobacteria bacterium]|tara:strand:+ start:227 stop:637 length:411 start_codon:yes stop_codon:yes gene_type:complete
MEQVVTDLKALEVAAAGTSVDLAEFLDAVKFNDQGLVPAIAQDRASGTVLMLAWMNRTSIEQTLASGSVTYFSRSRQSLWQKGETSGNTQRLLSMQFDCDGDAILMQVDQTGPACHTERANCFYLDVQGRQVVVNS